MQEDGDWLVVKGPGEGARAKEEEGRRKKTQGGGLGKMGHWPDKGAGQKGAGAAKTLSSLVSPAVQRPVFSLRPIQTNRGHCNVLRTHSARHSIRDLGTAQACS